MASSTCGATLAVGETCDFVLFFAPSAAGERSGVLTLSDNAAKGSQSVSLSGTGVDFTLIPNGATTATVSSGSSATFPLLLSSVSGLSGNVALSCAGAPAHSVCTVSPGTPSLGGSVQVSVVVQTGMATAEARPWRLPGGAGGVGGGDDRGVGGGGAVLAMVSIGWFGVRRRREGRKLSARCRVFTTLGLLAILGVAFTSLNGCGAGRAIPLEAGGGGATALATPTPSGSYNLTVTGATAGVTHSVGMNLTVQ